MRNGPTPKGAQIPHLAKGNPDSALAGGMPLAMKRILILLAAAMVVLGAASPALAQRDPFDPQEGSGSQEEPSGDEEGSADDPTVQPDDNTDADTDDETSPNQSEQLANTGANPEPWLVIAYALFAAGAAALFVSKVYSPVGNRK